MFAQQSTNEINTIYKKIIKIIVQITQQKNAKSLKYHEMQQSKFCLPVTATDATSGIRYAQDATTLSGSKWQKACAVRMARLLDPHFKSIYSRVASLIMNSPLFRNLPKVNQTDK